MVQYCGVSPNLGVEVCVHIQDFIRKFLASFHNLVPTQDKLNN